MELNWKGLILPGAMEQTMQQKSFQREEEVCQEKMGKGSLVRGSSTVKAQRLGQAWKIWEEWWCGT